MNKKAKTIKQIANQIGVSKQAVEKRIARPPLIDQLQGHITKDEKGIYRINAEGEQLIKDAYEFDEFTGISMNIRRENGRDEAANNAMQAAMASLMHQLEAKDKQISELSNALITSQRTTLAAQRMVESAQLLHAATMRTMIEASEAPLVETPLAETPPVNKTPTPKASEPKSGFWASIFRRKA